MEALSWHPGEQIRIVLVRPEYPGNIGAAARAMQNMGFRHLYLVAPQCEHWCSEARAMAYGALEILQEARVCKTVLEALEDIRFAVATTGHPFRDYERPVRLPQAAPEILAFARRGPVALLFGTERSGLTREEIFRCHRLVTIPTPGPHGSLNLAQAVMVMVYELTRGAADPLPPVPVKPATVGELEPLYQAWEALLTRMHLIRGEQGRSLLIRLRRIFSRTLLSRQELDMLQGIVREALWYVDQVESLPNPPRREKRGRGRRLRVEGLEDPS